MDLHSALGQDPPPLAWLALHLLLPCRIAVIGPVSNGRHGWVFSLCQQFHG